MKPQKQGTMDTDLYSLSSNYLSTCLYIFHFTQADGYLKLQAHFLTVPMHHGGGNSERR